MSGIKKTCIEQTEDKKKETGEHKPIWLQLTVGYQMDGSWIRVDEDDPAVKRLLEQGLLKLDRQ